MLKMWNTRAEIYIGNNVDYYVKSYQVKTTIVKFTKARIKWLEFNRSQKEALESPTSVWCNKKNLNMKQSSKRYQFK